MSTPLPSPPFPSPPSPPLSSPSRPSPPERPFSVAIATLWEGSSSYRCALLLWCSSAQRLRLAVNASALLVLSSAPSSPDCPSATFLWPTAFLPAAAAYSRALARAHPRLARHLLLPPPAPPLLPHLLKFALLGLTQYDVVFFADVDVDLAPHGHDRSRPPARLAAAAWRESLRAFAASAARLAAAPDFDAPVNTGSLLLKPSAGASAKLQAALRTATFSPRSGFNGVGSPRAAPPHLPDLAAGRGGGAREAARALNATGMMARDRWDFAGAAADQGVCWWFFFVAHRGGTWAAAAGPHVWTVDHWWGGDKPWRLARDAHARVAAVRYLWRLEGGGAAQNTSCGRELRALRARLQQLGVWFDMAPAGQSSARRGKRMIGSQSVLPSLSVRSIRAAPRDGGGSRREWI
ncbi:hypothetical protein AB1Y20_013567 [Prymnesium parvum]|uniref:Nucleotide-diphospho-sugar transferase domain-containing protein n=1 Tax=Prymnesium parvum TaxID=97485 RepID=A0AB34II83_PRYPA